MSLTLEDLRPVLDLINENNDQLHKNIKESSEATRELFSEKLGGVTKELSAVRKELKSHNGRLTKVEVAALEQITTCKVRGATCGAAMDKINTDVEVTSFIAKVKKNWRLFLVIFFVFVISIQVLIMEAIEKKWIGTIFDLIKP